jgi:hypothetical protein
MFSLLLLEKTGTIKEKKVKSLDKLYGLCNYRSEDGFELLHEWTKATTSYLLYGKRKGKQNGENKSVLPYPLEEAGFYGTLCLVKTVDGTEDSISLSEWTQFASSIHSEEIKSDEKELKKEEYEPE